MRPDKVQRGIVNKKNPPPPSVTDFEGDQRKGSAGYAFALYPTVEQVLADRRQKKARG